MLIKEWLYKLSSSLCSKRERQDTNAISCSSLLSSYIGLRANQGDERYGDKSHIEVRSPDHHGLTHGKLGQASWPAPRCVAEAPEEARPGFSSCAADEFEDDPTVFAEKAALVADLIRRSSHCIAYTGAGISTAAGINDYATKSNKTIIHSRSDSSNADGDHLLMGPTSAHRILSAMQNDGLLAHWLQQNHDGLPQKAGVPQSVINEIHGAWFDPSNLVVHFRAELRPDLFSWMLEEELRADLVLVAGTSLCDTPSTADRVVVTAMREAERDPNISSGAVIIGLQKTRLDQHAQVRVYGLIDQFFELVAQNLWGSSWQTTITSKRQCQRPGVAAKACLVETGGDLTPGQLVYLAAGPSAGRATRVAECTPQGHFEMDFGAVLGSWWLEAPLHPAMFPISCQAIKRPARYKRAMEAAMRVASFPAMPGPPQNFLDGVWEGNAVLISRERIQHPTASEDRAQHLRWVLGSGENVGDVYGAGFTTWPAAHVLLGTRGRVWHTLRGTYAPGEASLEVVAAWEAVPGPRIRADGLGPGQGEANIQTTTLTGRIWWDDRCSELCFGGSWVDSEGVQGAFLMVRRDPLGMHGSTSGAWTGEVEGVPQRWILTINEEMLPSAFGCMVIGDGCKDNNGLLLLRGLVDKLNVRLRRLDHDGNTSCTYSLRVDENNLQSSSPQVAMQLSGNYVPMQTSDLLGVFEHSVGGLVEVTLQDGWIIIKNPRLKQPEKVRVEGVCIDGAARLFKLLGRLVPRTLHRPERIEWSNGSIWTRQT